MRLWLGLGGTVAVVLACAGPVHAEALGDSIAAQLRAEGFGTVQVSRTLLGRTQIIAEGTPGHREIVLDPRTGEILRDIFLAPNDDAAHGSGSGRGSGGSGSDDDGGDDHHGGDNGGDDGGGDNGGEGGRGGGGDS